MLNARAGGTSSFDREPAQCLAAEQYLDFARSESAKAYLCFALLQTLAVPRQLDTPLPVIGQ